MRWSDSASEGLSPSEGRSNTESSACAESFIQVCRVFLRPLSRDGRGELVWGRRLDDVRAHLRRLREVRHEGGSGTAHAHHLAHAKHRAEGLAFAR